MSKPAIVGAWVGLSFLCSCQHAENNGFFTPCDPVWTGGTLTTSNTYCSGCTFTGGQAAIDDDSGTAATVTFDEATTGTAVLRATSPGNAVLPFPSNAGANLTFVDQQRSNPYIGVYVDLYRGGVFQDRIYGNGSFAPDSSVSNGTYSFLDGCSRDCALEKQHVGSSATVEYDSIEIGIAREESGVVQVVKVNDFCVEAY